MSSEPLSVPSCLTEIPMTDRDKAALSLLPAIYTVWSNEGTSRSMNGECWNEEIKREAARFAYRMADALAAVRDE